jgi:flavoprotein
MSDTNQAIEFRKKQCKGCGRTMQPTLPPVREITMTDDIIGIRCKECGQINECEKQGSMG